MFERLAKQTEILENTWVTHLLGLLPYDVAQLIAKEPHEIANDYGEVKKILLKRIGDRVHIGYREDEPFRNFPIDENLSRICLKALEATKLEKNTIDLVSYRAESIENGLIMIENPSEDIGCLLEVKDGKTCVPLANIGDKNIEFLKDQCLGRAEVIELCSNVKVKERMQSSNNLDNFKE
ncbi:hypothetical protein AVEN_11013-1 [Araneus ventricosus]|uniref:Uncharacterized protein n=1 Tax=Araneus ventricosus TaxID=182803 RepID=A0A4Y2HGJ4_ARAVE|nr:hypothetical protein AVEN_11013-1 [Araneus ventricosus]